MADLDLVDVLDAGDNLLHEATRLLFLQALPFDDVVEQFTSAGILHDQEQLARRLDNLVKLDDVRVTNYLQNVDLSGHPVNIRLVFNLVFLKNLNSYFFACDKMRAEAHLSERSLTK